MRLKTPAFWYAAPNAAPARTLAPLAKLYDRARRLLALVGAAPEAAVVPVICVGNLTAGGGGKTPVALAVASLLRDAEIVQRPGFLSRGYGGRVRTPTVIRPEDHKAADVGDEPLLLARAGPTVVAQDRPAGAHCVVTEGCDAIIMDDGFQNTALRKDISLLVIDGAVGLGNGFLLPAGPLREPPEEAFARADAVILVGEDKTDIRARLPAGLRIFEADTVVPEDWRAAADTPYVAFCGIARPEKFQATLAAQGIVPQAFLTFPDHAPYTPRARLSLTTAAEKHKARLITTEKDAVRLSAEFIEEHEVEILPITLRWRDKNAVAHWLAEYWGKTPCDHQSQPQQKRAPLSALFHAAAGKRAA